MEKRNKLIDYCRSQRRRTRCTTRGSPSKKKVQVLADAKMVRYGSAVTTDLSSGLEANTSAQNSARTARYYSIKTSPSGYTILTRNGLMKFCHVDLCGIRIDRFAG